MLYNFSHFSFSIPGIKSRALHVLVKVSTAELHPSLTQGEKLCFDAHSLMIILKSKPMFLKNISRPHINGDYLWVVAHGWFSSTLLHFVCFTNCSQKHASVIFINRKPTILHKMIFITGFLEDIHDHTHPPPTAAPSACRPADAFAVAAHAEVLTC